MPIEAVEEEITDSNELATMAVINADLSSKQVGQLLGDTSVGALGDVFSPAPPLMARMDDDCNNSSDEESDDDDDNADDVSLPRLHTLDKDSNINDDSNDNANSNTGLTGVSRNEVTNAPSPPRGS